MRKNGATGFKMEVAVELRLVLEMKGLQTVRSKHARTHALTHSDARKRIHPNTYEHTHTHKSTLKHMRTRVRTPSNTFKDNHDHPNTFKHVHTHTLTHTLTHTHTHIHSNAHTQATSHISKCSHLNVQSLPCNPFTESLFICCWQLFFATTTSE